MPITADSMRESLVPLDTVREALAATEPLGTHTFSLDEAILFDVASGWNHGIDGRPGNDTVPAAVYFGRTLSTEYQLTKDAVFEAAQIAGLRPSTAERLPGPLLSDHLNFWFRTAHAGKAKTPKEYQLLTTGGIGAAITKASVNPFSNLALLDRALAGIEARYGTGEVLADYKFTHTLKRTHLRLIVPEHRRVIERTGTDNDEWSVGLQIKNSLIGDDRTSIDGYLFRWWCTNGAIDTKATSGVWKRRNTGGEAEVYEWARAAVDDILGGLESTLDSVQSMVDIPIDGDAHTVLRDVFEHYRVPVPERARIIDELLAAGQLTMYALMQAITTVANTADLDPSHVEALMRVGGDLPHTAHERCTGCQRLIH